MEYMRSSPEIKKLLEENISDTAQELYTKEIPDSIRKVNTQSWSISNFLTFVA